MTKDQRENCPVHQAVDIVGDQWVLLILREFFLEGPRRFQDLQNVLGVSPTTLSARLKRLEQAGLVERHQYSGNPPRSEYHLTESGTALAPVIEGLRNWGQRFGTVPPGSPGGT